MGVSQTAVKAGKAYVELGVHDRLARGLRRAQARLKAFGLGVQQIGMRLIKLGALMAAPFALGAKAYATFDQQMRMVSTMLGDAAGKWMPVFSKAAQKMSMEFGQSMESIAKGMYDLLSAQVPPAQMLEVLRVAMKGATGGMTDTAVAVKALVRIMRGFGLDASRAADIGDVLFTIVEKGVINFEELAESIGTVAPSAKAAGMTLDQLAAAVATVVSVEEPKRAMTALRTGIFEAAEAGMDFLAFARKFEGADLGAIIQAGIPKKAAQGIVILAQNMDLLDSNIAAMQGRAGAADAAYKKMAAGLMHSWNQLKAGAWVIFIKIGKAIEKPLTAAADWMKKWSGIIGDFIDRNQGLIASVAKLATLFLAAGVSLLLAGFLIAKLAALLTLVKIAIWLIVPGALALKVALFALAHPIALIGLAVAGLGVFLLYITGAGAKALSWLGDRFGDLMEDAGKSFDGIKKAMKAGDIGLAAEILWLTLKKWWTKGSGWLLDKWYAVKNKMVEWATAGFYGIARVWTKVVAKLKAEWAKFAAVLKMAKSKAVSFVARQATHGAYAEQKALEERRLSRGEQTPEQYAVAMKHWAEVYGGAQAQLQREAAAEEAAIRDEFIARLRQINSDEAGSLADLANAKAEADDLRQRKLNEDLDGIAARRKKVEEELAAALAKKPAGKPEEAPAVPEEIAAALQRAMGNLPKQLNQAARTGGTARGIFGAKALQSLLAGGGNAAQRTAEATERIARNTATLRSVDRLAFT